MKWTRPRAALLAVTLLASMAGAPATVAADPPTIVVENGVTQPVFGYADAIRERIFVPSDFDSDLNGVPDIIAMDIMRPAATAEGLTVPVIMDASPYYTTSCRGNDSECIADFNADGINDRWPLFYDNWFVPRGYAHMLLHMVGTASSDGCPVTGGTPDNRSAVMAIDWLNGRRAGFDAAGNEVFATWHNGKTGMIGKSYDGTLANAAAAIGVEGLTTIVPISAISNWYFYTRQNGLGLSGWSNNYPASLSNTVTNAARRTYCAPIRTILNNTDGDESFDYTPFWQERDYLPHLDNVKASVFLVHGIQDDNVKANNFSEWWYGLAERNVPRKLWLGRTGHTDPFDFRRAVWVDTLHRWFDHWLQGVENGIMDEPQAMVEHAPGQYVDYDVWPPADTAKTSVYFRATPSGAGDLSLSQDAAAPTTAFLDATGQTETTMINNPNTVTNNKRVFLSPVLTEPLRFAGTPYINLVASANRVGTSLGALIVDYGPSTQHVSRSGEGVTTSSATDCWGLQAPNAGTSTGDFDACYRITGKNLTNSTQWRVSRGIMDSRNRDDLTTPTPLVVGEYFNARWDLQPEDYIFLPGHRIGVILVMSYSGLTAANTNYGATLTVDLQQSHIELPLVGGYAAAVAAGITDTVAPSITVPDDITVEATGPTTPVEFSVSASDPEDPNPSVGCDYESGHAFSVGTTTVTCTAIDGATNATVDTFDVIVTDTTAPTIDPLADITVNATAPEGAVVEWVATASDIVDITVPVVCVPPSGSVFAIGDTTVDCSATDSSSNTAYASFSVHVKSADEQLSDLHTYITGVGPGTALADQVAKAQARLAAGQVTLACNDLTKSIPRTVASQTGKTITAEQAAAILADAARIADTIGCS